MKSHGYAAHDKKSPLVPFSFDRRDPGPNDVVVEIAYCGICHSDIHQVRDEWGNAIYPMVPGHEIVGRVSQGWGFGQEVQGRRSRRRGRDGRLLPGVRELQGRGTALLREGDGRDLQRS